jgi:glycosyltransferase involved in cell wall biosynthesis
VVTVCHIISGYFRNDARVFLRQCKSLQKHEFGISILTNDGEPAAILEGVPVHVCRRFWPRWKTLLFARRQFIKEALEINADIYQLHSPELLSLGISLKRAGKKVVYDAHEDMPRHILEKEWLPKVIRQPLSVIFEKYMLWALRKYDEIVSPHSHVVSEFQNHLGKGILIANFPIIRSESLFSEHDYNKRDNILCYSGTVYSYSNQEEILTALSPFNNLRYQVAGYVDDRHARSLQSMPNGHKVTFLGRLSRQRLYEFYRSVTIGVVVYDYKLNLGWKLGSYGTNKIFEYMEAGLPFICTDYTLWEEIALGYNCGLCVSPGKPEEISAAITYLLEDKARAYKMGQNGRKAVLDMFNWNSEEKKYISLFRWLSDTN